jgi:hypothetical protein
MCPAFPLPPFSAIPPPGFERDFGIIQSNNSFSDLLGEVVHGNGYAYNSEGHPHEVPYIERIFK